MLPELETAMQTLDDFVQVLVAALSEGVAGEARDLLRSSAARGRGRLSERELYDLLIFVFVAGYDTSKNALTLLMDVMIQRPDIYERCARTCRGAAGMEENFRYLTTSTVPRLITKDIVYRA